MKKTDKEHLKSLIKRLETALDGGKVENARIYIDSAHTGIGNHVRLDIEWYEGEFSE